MEFIRLYKAEKKELYIMGRPRDKIKIGTLCKECRKEHFRNSAFCSKKCQKIFTEKAKNSIAKVQQMAYEEGLSYGQFVAKYGL